MGCPATDGNAGAWQEAVLEQRAWLEGLIGRRVGSPEAAPDLVQETLLAAVRNGEPPGGARNLRAWLGGIARNKVRRHFEQRRRELRFAPAGDTENRSSESLAHITTGYGQALEEGIVWEPQLRWDGAMSYVTRQQVPGFIRDAVLMAGHRVEREERVVQLGNAEDSGEGWKIPVSETRIIENRPL